MKKKENMKKNLFAKLLLITFMIFTVLSCDNEVLEGEFIDDICTLRVADIKEIRADVEGSDFQADVDIETNYLTGNSAVVVIHSNGFTHLTMSGFNTGEAGFLTLNINSPTVGTFVLETNNEFGDVSNENDHELLENYGTYHVGPLPDTNEEIYNPYVTYIPNGGIGEAEITEFNMEEQYASGTFSYTGARIRKDIVTGEPILDESGNPIIETFEVECGNFNRVQFTIYDYNDDDNTQGTFNGAFDAKVDGVDFVAVSFTATRVTIGEGDNAKVVIKVEAVNDVGDLLRIDIPEELTEGTYDMVNISDGTQLIGMYNPTMTASENLTSNPGTITITDINAFTGDIEATFSFTGTDPLGIDPAVVEVTEGSFVVDYIPSINVSNIITAEVNGEAYGSTHSQSTTSVFNGITRYQFISNDISSNQSIRLIFPSTIEIGSYDISTTLITGEEILALYTFDDGVTPTLVATSGSLIVTDLNEDTGLIDGTFEFTAVDTSVDPPLEYIITSGEFSLFLQ